MSHDCTFDVLHFICSLALFISCSVVILDMLLQQVPTVVWWLTVNLMTLATIPALLAFSES